MPLYLHLKANNEVFTIPKIIHATLKHIKTVASTSNFDRVEQSPLLYAASHLFQRRDCFPIRFKREDPNAGDVGQDSIASIFRRVDRNSREVIVYAYDSIIPGADSGDKASKVALYEDELINSFQRSLYDFGK
ncbi:hypothetical protein O181_097125 [Austropuccinia psidii MF-1]|uniref:Uncharacterized protein n=1 Tax=Austropuccinia psidii MF-1 TaxID=1389203 RepID=A0A9Q3J8Y2_9BASI|nr:hypothetical protein [Austropuccinia psidii MF-1]